MRGHGLTHRRNRGHGWLGILGVFLVAVGIATAVSAVQTKNERVVAQGDTSTSSNTANRLVISQDAVSEVTLDYDGNQRYDTHSWSASGGNGADERVWSDWTKKRENYTRFTPGAGTEGIVFTRITSQGKDDSPYPQGTIDGNVNLNYSNVGLYNFGSTEEPNLQPIGARVTVSDIIYGDQPKWSGSTNPYILFSDNFFSGVVYGGIKSMHMTVEFYSPSDPSKAIDLGQKQSVFTFNSLNAGQGTNEADMSAEYAGLADGSATGIGSSDSLISYHKNGVRGADYTNNTYYADGTTDFQDTLGSSDFQRASISLPLSGTSTTFVFGSVWGRAWNAFSSATVYPTTQSKPIKTVEPINQFQDGDTWDKPTGSETGYSQRYDDDLDRYTGDDGFSSTYAQTGHTADSDLNPGIPKRADRYVTTGQEFYYYINQPTIDLSSQGLIVPNGYEITDTLPDGVQFESATLYGLDGSELGSTETAFSNQSETSTNNLKFVLSNDATNSINTLSRQAAYFGKDFTIRVKCRVTNTTADKIDDTMDNVAESTFNYDNDVNLTQKSNKVQIAVKGLGLSFAFTKVDDNGTALAGATFELTPTNETEGEKQSATSDKNGQVQFATELEAGTYTLTETKAPEGYEKLDQPVELTVAENKNGELVATESNRQGVFESGAITAKSQVEDKKIPGQVTVKKVDESGHPLKDATFTLTGNGLNRTETTNNEGEATFDELELNAEYTVTETGAPKGYQLADAQKVTAVKGDATQIYTFIDKLAPINLLLKKVASDTDKMLKGAQYTLNDPDDTDKVLYTSDTVRNNDTYNLTFTNVKPGTYQLTEAKAPNGYQLASAVTVEVGTQVVNGELTIWVKSENDTFAVNLSEDGRSDNNTEVIKLQDAPAGQLPSTGGTGPLKIAAVAAAMLICAAGLFGIAMYQKHRGDQL